MTPVQLQNMLKTFQAVNKDRREDEKHALELSQKLLQKDDIHKFKLAQEGVKLGKSVVDAFEDDEDEGNTGTVTAKKKKNKVEVSIIPPLSRDMPEMPAMRSSNPHAS